MTRLLAVAALIWLASPTARAQSQSSSSLVLPMAAGPLSIQTVGPTSHTFQPIMLTGGARPHLSMTLLSPPAFQISNPGGNGGWSVRLTTSRLGHHLAIDYLPGSGTVARLTGAAKPEDLLHDQNLEGTSLLVGRKVLSAAAGTHYGNFRYIMSATGWEMPLLPAAVAPGTYSWTLTATLSAGP